jgi:hypothetical protein
MHADYRMAFARFLAMSAAIRTASSFYIPGMLANGSDGP